LKKCSDPKHYDDPVRLKTCKLVDRYTMEVDINVKRDERIINRSKDKNNVFRSKFVVELFLDISFGELLVY